MTDTVQSAEQASADAADKLDTFAEKLRHVLNLAEVEVEHLWDEAVALAKKLV